MDGKLVEFLRHVAGSGPDRPLCVRFMVTSCCRPWLLPQPAGRPPVRPLEPSCARGRRSR
jgi:hypothetical protein